MTLLTDAIVGLLAAACVMCVGCATRPGVDVSGNAKVSIDQPLPVNVSTTQPINVTVEGFSINYEGTFIPDPLFQQVNDGASMEYVAAVFGKPDFDAKLGDGTIIWRWKYRPQQQSVSLLEVFGKKDDDKPKPDHVTTLVIFSADGKVQRKWRG